MNKLFALVDCNNFYVSCERLFRPELNGRPVVVLSNNDGCIVARSNEVKALGIAMGAPYFKNKSLIKKHNITVFSSNYALYGDISQRVMNVLQQLEPEVEIYSIDESFITLPLPKKSGLSSYIALKKRVEQCVGIPVSVGVAPTKTLAKIANHLAKKGPRYAGVFDITSCPNIDQILCKISVGDIWGIGRRSAEKLSQIGITTGLQLKNAEQTWIRKHLSVTGLRIVKELQGEPCIPLEESASAKKSIVSSRSFSRPVEAFSDLREAVSSYVSIAAAKLRAQNSVASTLHVFINTNRFKKNSPQYNKTLAITMPQATSSTAVLIKHAARGLETIYKATYQYQKAGVMLTGLSPDNCRQLNLFYAADHRQPQLMHALDKINAQWGQNTLQFAATGLYKPWSMKQSKKSPAYTTRWHEIPVVKASFPTVQPI